MSVQKIKIKNILSFRDVEIKDVNDMNCIVGKNNVGKSNLLKVLKFYYNKLDGKEELPPKLNSNYSHSGSISITFDTTRIFTMAKKMPQNKYFSYVTRKLIPPHKRFVHMLKRYDTSPTHFTLTLHIYNDGSTKWSNKDRQTLNLILYLYPFFHIEPRHMDLHQWDSLWDLISRIKSFNLSNVDSESIVKFFDGAINSGSESSYKKYVDDLNVLMTTKPSTPKERILSYIKAGLRGQKFEIDDKDLKFQSDGTNSFHFIRTFLKILITVSRREYITPFVFIDEPELGLHPKMNEVLIHDVCSFYNYEKSSTSKSPKPKIFITTHSANVVKEVIKKFRAKQSVFCFQKPKNSGTEIKLLNSKFDSESFINRFSDNEARLFFSNFILFVEGETELELFGNMMLLKHFPHLSTIDVIKSSDNSVGEKVNPSYSNSAIPYLFLFDADKAISYKKSKTGQLVLDLCNNGNYFNLSVGELQRQYKKYSFGYSKNYAFLKNNIKVIIDSNELPVKIKRVEQRFSEPKNFDLIFAAVKNHLLQKNMYLARTTIEGCLINRSSSELFFRWLDDERSLGLMQLFNKLKDRKYLTESLLIDYMRVIFNGKTETLYKYKKFNPNGNLQYIKKGGCHNNKTKETGLREKSILNFIEKKYICNENVGKTDGWVTNFLNYSVSCIENEAKASNLPFGSVFKIYFPELYDIIRMLQPDSRGEI